MVRSEIPVSNSSNRNDPVVVIDPWNSYIGPK